MDGGVPNHLTDDYFLVYQTVLIAFLWHQLNGRLDKGLYNLSDMSSDILSSHLTHCQVKSAEFMSPLTCPLYTATRYSQVPNVTDFITFTDKSVLIFN